MNTLILFQISTLSEITVFIEARVGILLAWLQFSRHLEQNKNKFTPKISFLLHFLFSLTSGSSEDNILMRAFFDCIFQVGMIFAEIPAFSVLFCVCWRRSIWLRILEPRVKVWIYILFLYLVKVGWDFGEMTVPCLETGSYPCP